MLSMRAAVERREVERWAVDAVVEASVKYHTISPVACVASGLYRHQQPAVRASML